jgi:hypothetical protein
MRLEFHSQKAAPVVDLSQLNTVMVVMVVVGVVVIDCDARLVVAEVVVVCRLELRRRYRHVVNCRHERPRRSPPALRSP